MAQYGLFGIAHILERTVYAIVSVTNPSDAKVKEYLRDKYDKEFIAVDRSPSKYVGHFLYAPADAPEDVFDVATRNDRGGLMWTDGYQLLLARRAGQPEVERIVKKYLPDATDIWYTIRLHSSLQVAGKGWNGNLGDFYKELGSASMDVRLHLEQGEPSIIQDAFESIMDELNNQRLVGSYNQIIVLPSDIPTDVGGLTPGGGPLSYMEGKHGMSWWYDLQNQKSDDAEAKYHGFQE